MRERQWGIRLFHKWNICEGRLKGGGPSEKTGVKYTSFILQDDMQKIVVVPKLRHMVQVQFALGVIPGEKFLELKIEGQVLRIPSKKACDHQKTSDQDRPSGLRKGPFDIFLNKGIQGFLA